MSEEFDGIPAGKCNHKSDKLHDVFTQHDPKLSLVIQHLKVLQPLRLS